MNLPLKLQSLVRRETSLSSQTAVTEVTMEDGDARKTSDQARFVLFWHETVTDPATRNLYAFVDLELEVWSP